MLPMVTPIYTEAETKFLSQVSELLRLNEAAHEPYRSRQKERIINWAIKVMAKSASQKILVEWNQ